ncbi:MAG TPA: S-layer homology domain-containing protein, partial [Candidatus Wallbacteria bacterium]|nr:S-layer homology domain-containing protein [Candidatus Wallbacteria bacterium]
MMLYKLIEKTIKNNISARPQAGLTAVCAFALAFLFFTASSMAAPFTDVSKDHWAYEAIDKLVQNGYMDGFADDTFRGRKVVTRYEIALTLAKILTKVEDVESSGGIISPKDAEIIKSLATEFREELNTLGAKVNTLDQRVTELEKFKKNVEKIKWAGYYQVTDVAVWDRLTTIDDGDNSDDDFDEGDANGLGKLKNKVNLKLTGKPFDNVETYTEIKAFINSAKGPSKSYIYKSDNTIRPYLEKYMSDFYNDRDLIMEKMHLK